MKLSHKLNDAVCVTNQLPTLICGLLSNSSVLLQVRQFCGVLRERVFVGLQLIF